MSYLSSNGIPLGCRKVTVVLEHDIVDDVLYHQYVAQASLRGLDIKTILTNAFAIVHRADTNIKEETYFTARLLTGRTNLQIHSVRAQLPHDTTLWLMEYYVSYFLRMWHPVTQIDFVGITLHNNMLLIEGIEYNVQPTA